MTNEPFGYTNWQPGEPNNSSGAENRIVFFRVGGLIGDRWNDIGETALERGYVVEWETCPDSPDISVVPDTIETNIGVLESTTLPMRIANAGVQSLQWSLDFGNALALDGSDDFVSLGNLNPGSRWTLEAWVRPSDVPPGGRHTILGGMTECNDWGVVIQSGVFGVAVRYSGCTTTHLSSIAPVAGTWYHVAAANDGQNVLLYVNGVLAVSGGVVPNYVGTSTSTRIGGEVCCPGNNYGGLADEVKMWNRALSLSEVRASMSGLLPGPDPNLIGYWTFDETSGDVLDRSGQAHHGGLANGASRTALTSPLQTWLSVAPSSGATPGGDTATVIVTIDGRGQIAGPHRAAFQIASNDPDEPRTTVPVLIGLSAIPRISVPSDSLTFAPTFVGYADTVEAIVRSIGTDVLHVTSLTASGPYALLDPQAFDLLPGQQHAIPVRFAPNVVGEASGTLVVRSDDAVDSAVVVVLVGRGLPLPEISVPTDTLFATLEHGDSATATLRVGNTGPGALSWALRDDQALTFDGVDDAVNTGAWSPGSQWTVEAWVRASESSTGRRAIAGGISNCRDWGLALFDGYFGGLIRPANETCTSNIISSIEAAVGVWYHVAEVSDGHTASLYVNGEIQATAAVSLNYVATSAGTFIGGAVCCAPGFPGAIDDVMIWNRPLSPAEIRTSMQASGIGLGPGLVGHWSFDEGSGGTAFDLSGADHHGVVMGGALRTASEPSPAAWLRVAPVAGALAGPGSTPIALTFDARRTMGGTFDAKLVVSSNDPVRPLVEIPARLRVHGTPVLSLSGETLAFGSTLIGSTATQDVVVTNLGTDSLRITSLSVSGEFEVAEVALVIAAGRSRAISVRHAPASLGVASGSLQIASDDPDRSTATVALAGTGVQEVTYNLDTRRLERLGLLQRASGMRPFVQIVGGAASLASDADGDSVWSSRVVNASAGPIRFYFGIDPNGNGVDDASEWVVERGGSANPREHVPVAEPASLLAAVAFDDLPLDGTAAGYRALITRSVHPGDGPEIAFTGPQNETFASIDIETLDQPALISVRRYASGAGGAAPPGVVVVSTNASWGLEICPAAAVLSGQFRVRYGAFSGVVDPTDLRVLRRDLDATQYELLASELNLNSEKVSGSIVGPGRDGRSVLTLGSASVDNPLAPEPPGQASSPFPAVGTTGVPVRPRLSWFPAPGAQSYDVRLWPAGDSEPASPTATGLTTTSWEPPGPLAYGTAYAWRVTGFNLDGATPGPLWSFTSDELPDLVVTDLQGPSDAFSEQIVQVTWQIRNDGARATRNDAWMDAVYLSPSSVFDPGSARLLAAFDNLTALEIGQSYQRTGSVRLPRGIAGDYYIVLVTDVYGRMLEQNETENTRIIPLQVNLTPVPDLQVASVGVPEQAFSGDMIPVSWTVENRGQGPTLAGSWRDALYLSDDASLDTRRDTYLGSAQHNGGLDAGEGYAANASVRLPRSIYGTHTLFVLTDTEDNVYEHFFEGNNAASDTIQITLTPPPDLIVTSVTAPSAGDAGRSIRVEWTVENQGPGDTFESFWQDAIYLSTSPAFDPGNSTLLTRAPRYAGLPAGAQYSDAIDVTLPNAAAGNRWVFVRTDVDGQVFEHTAEDNNVTRAPSPCGVAWPDLAVARVVAPSSGESGDTITVSWTIKNLGPGRLVQRVVSDHAYVQADSILDVAQAFDLGAFARTLTLEVGDSATTTRGLVLPNGISGRHHVHLWTDWDDRIGEAGSEFNNRAASAAIQVALTPWPNLVPTSVVTPASAVAGQRLDVEWTVTNVGVAQAVGGWIDRVYLASSPTWPSQGAMLLGSMSGPAALGPGAFYTRSLTPTLPIGLSAGTYYAYVISDADGAQYEHTDEGDNRVRGAPILVVAAPQADLEVSEYAPPSTLGSGDAVTLHWLVRNGGAWTTLANGWDDAVYLSSDSVVSPATDVLLAQPRRVGALPTGASYVRNVGVRIPDGLRGRFWLLVAVDVNGIVTESGRANNVAGRDTPVDVELTPSPDFVVSSLDAPAFAELGHVAEIGWTIRNLGTASPTSGWYDAVYLSSDPFMSADDYRLATKSRNEAIAPDGSASATESVEIPQLPSTGTYYWVVAADTRNDLFEHGGEANNTRASPVIIGAPAPADLVVTDVSGPASLVPGEDVTLRWTIENRGVNPATGVIRDAVYLSADTTWTLDDPLAGVLNRQIDLAPGASMVAEAIVSTKKLFLADAAGTITGPAPALTPGKYVVIARVNLRRTVGESDFTNNLGVSSDSIDASILTLTLGERDTIALEQSHPRYFKIDVPDSLEGRTLQVFLDGARPDIAGEMYVRFDEAPTASVFDVKSDVPFRTAQRLAVPEARVGTYYLLVQARGTGAQTANVMARAVGFGIASVTPSEGGQGGRITVRLDGTGLIDPPTVFLRRLDQEFRSVASYHIGATETYVTFDLAQVPLGVYDMVVRQDLSYYVVTEDSIPAFIPVLDSSEVVLPNAFSVVPPVVRPPELRLVRPSALRPNRYFETSLYVANRSNNDIYCPLLAFSTLPDIRSTLRGREDAAYGLRHIVCTSPDGPAGVLRPGGVSIIRIGGYPSRPGVLTLRVRALGGGSGFSFIEEMQRLGIDPDDPKWKRAIQDLARRAGGDWSGYQKLLSEAATLVSRGGGRGKDMDALIRALLGDTQGAFDDSAAAAGGAVPLRTNEVDAERVASPPASAPTSDRVCPVGGFSCKIECGFSNQYLDRAAVDALGLLWSPCSPDASSLLADYVAGYHGTRTFGPGTRLADEAKDTAEYTKKVEAAREFAKGAVRALVGSSCASGHHEGSIGIPSSVLGSGIFPNRYSGIRGLLCGNLFYAIHGFNSSGYLKNVSWTASERSDKCGNHWCARTISGTIELSFTDEYEFTEQDVCDPISEAPKWKRTIASWLGCRLVRLNTCGRRNGSPPLGFKTVVMVAVPFTVTDEPDKPPCDEPGDGDDVPVVASVDPNDIIGPAGALDERWVDARDSLEYMIRFENDPDRATAPAQVVTITQTLDPHVDARKFRLGRFGFGPFVFEVPENRSFHSARLDVRDSLGLFVDYVAGIDVVNNRAFWTLRSVDPATGEAPADPRAGFLAVNDALGRGEGFVTYTIVPKTTTRTRDRVLGKAQIVFDRNEPLDTPEIFNTLDATPPSTRVAPLEAEQYSTQFEVHWGGSDPDSGSGIRAHDVYVQAGLGAFAPWLTATAETSAVFEGVEGETYRFFSIGIDQAGLREAAPSTPDAVTKINTVLATEVALVEAHVDDDGVILMWHSPMHLSGAAVYRSEGDAAWAKVGEVASQEDGVLTYRDRSVLAGRRYGYRLGLLENGTLRFYGEAWTQIPVPVLALYGARPNPATRELNVVFSLPSANPATVTIYDVAGRQVESQSVGRLGSGRHVAIFGRDRRVLPGIYWIRLIQGRRTLTARAVVIQ